MDVQAFVKSVGPAEVARRTSLSLSYTSKLSTGVKPATQSVLVTLWRLWPGEFDLAGEVRGLIRRDDGDPTPDYVAALVNLIEVAASQPDSVMEGSVVREVS